MKVQLLHKLHRYVGITTAPFLVIQTVSGLLLGFGIFRQPGSSAHDRSQLILPGSWDDFLVKIHFKAGLAGDIYHLLLATGIILMALTGSLMYLKLRSGRRSLDAKKNTSPGTGAGAS